MFFSFCESIHVTASLLRSHVQVSICTGVTHTASQKAIQILTFFYLLSLFMFLQIHCQLPLHIYTQMTSYMMTLVKATSNIYSFNTPPRMYIVRTLYTHKEGQSSTDALKGLGSVSEWTNWAYSSGKEKKDSTTQQRWVFYKSAFFYLFIYYS